MVIDMGEELKTTECDSLKLLPHDTLSYLVHGVMNGSVSPDTLVITDSTITAEQDGTPTQISIDEVHVEVTRQWLRETNHEAIRFHWVDVDRLMPGAWMIIVYVDDESTLIPM